MSSEAGTWALYDRIADDRLRSQVESEPEALIPWFIGLGLKLTRIGLEAAPQFAMALCASVFDRDQSGA
jgi:hypothetical protein